MSCHGNNNDHKEQHGHSPIKHMIHMVLCCGLPILIIALLPFISTFSPAISRILLVIAPFICPIMMIGMIFMMFGRGNNKKSSCCKDEEIINPTE